MAISPINNLGYAYCAKNNKTSGNKIPFRGEPAAPVVAATPQTPQPTPEKKKHTALIIGGSIAAVIALGFVCRRPLARLFNSGAKIANESKNTTSSTIKKTGDDVVDNTEKLIHELTDKEGFKVIIENDPQTKNMSKMTQFRKDGKTIKDISEYDPQTKKIIKLTEYKEDGTTPNFIGEFDGPSGKVKTTTSFGENGMIKNKMEWPYGQLRVFV